WLDDGNVEFIGRLDHQLKFNGFRIEPGEIEKQIESLNEIVQAVVLLRENEAGRKQLVAYAKSSREQQTSDPADLKKKINRVLEDNLPDYMVPQAIVILTEFPALPNGKVDRSALRTLEHETASPGVVL